MIFERLLTALGLVCRGPLAQQKKTADLRTLKTFLKALGEQTSDDFFGKECCLGANKAAALLVLDSASVEALVTAIQVYAPQLSMDHLDAVIDVDDCDDSMVALMGYSNGRILIQQAMQALRDRNAAHSFNVEVARVMEQIGKAGEVESLDGDVPMLHQIEKQMAKIEDMKGTKRQELQIREAAQSQMKTHMLLSGKPLAVLGKLFQLLREGR